MLENSECARPFALPAFRRVVLLSPIFVSGFSLAGYYTLAMILDCDLLRGYAETRSEDATLGERWADMWNPLGFWKSGAPRG